MHIKIIQLQTWRGTYFQWHWWAAMRILKSSHLSCLNMCSQAYMSEMSIKTVLRRALISLIKWKTLAWAHNGISIHGGRCNANKTHAATQQLVDRNFIARRSFKFHFCNSLVSVFGRSLCFTRTHPLPQAFKTLCAHNLATFIMQEIRLNKCEDASTFHPASLCKGALWLQLTAWWVVTFSSLEFMWFLSWVESLRGNQKY